MSGLIESYSLATTLFFSTCLRDCEKLYFDLLSTIIVLSYISQYHITAFLYQEDIHRKKNETTKMSKRIRWLVLGSIIITFG